MQQLTPREAALLDAESYTNLGHTSLYTELDSSTTDLPMSLTRVRAELADRLDLVPGFRRRVHRVPYKLDLPWWIEDPKFDLEYHLRHIAVPQPGDRASLTKLVARLHERPLDRRRPLWEIYLIDLPSGNVGLFTKMHHALIDGVTGLDVLAPLTVPPGESSDGGASPYQPDRIPDDSDLLIRAVWSLARSPMRLAQLALRGVGQLPVVGRMNLLGLLAPWTSPRGALDISGETPAPRTSFNRSIGAHRRVAFATLPVAELREVRREHGVRFNDVVLALVAGTLRNYLVLNDELPIDPLVALSPILVDSVDEPLGTALVPLATHRHEPQRRLADIATATAEITDSMEAQRVDAIRSMYAASPAVAALASRLISRTSAFTRFLPPFNVYVVNVPGGDAETYVAGAKVTHQHPLATLIDGTGLSISIMSHDEVVDFSFVADRDLVPDLDVLADWLPHELEILAGRKAA